LSVDSPLADGPRLAAGNIGGPNVRLILIAAGVLLTGCVDTFAQF
jgi:hypothetical protein